LENDEMTSDEFINQLIQTLKHGNWYRDTWVCDDIEIRFNKWKRITYILKGAATSLHFNKKQMRKLNRAFVWAYLLRNKHRRDSDIERTTEILKSIT
jgi:hypothetical protein